MLEFMGKSTKVREEKFTSEIGKLSNTFKFEDINAFAETKTANADLLFDENLIENIKKSFTFVKPGQDLMQQLEGNLFRLPIFRDCNVDIQNKDLKLHYQCQKLQSFQTSLKHALDSRKGTLKSIELNLQAIDHLAADIYEVVKQTTAVESVTRLSLSARTEHTLRVYDFSAEYYESVIFDFSDTKEHKSFYEKIVTLVKTCHSHKLRHFELNLADSMIEDESLERLGDVISNWVGVTSLFLDLSHCSRLTKHGIKRIFSRISGLKSLHRGDLRLKGCSQVSYNDLNAHKYKQIDVEI